MVAIGSATQNRLLEAAKRHLGPTGDDFVRTAARQALGVPLDAAAYDQMPRLFTFLEQSGAALAGKEMANRLAASLYELQREADPGLSVRLVDLVNKHLGPAARPFLVNVCTSLKLSLESIDSEQLPKLATAVHEQGAPLLGEVLATALAQDVRQAASAKPAGLARKIVDIAVDHLGDEGASMITALCRHKLEVNVADLNCAGVGALAQVVEREGPELCGATRIAEFLVAARMSLASPAAPLRAKILDIARRAIGPVAEDFVREACQRGGLPFDAVDFEHLMWLAETMRAEGAALLGRKTGDDLARQIRGLLTGGLKG